MASTTVGDLDLSNVGNLPRDYDEDYRTRTKLVGPCGQIVGAGNFEIVKAYALSDMGVEFPYHPPEIEKIREFIRLELPSLRRRGTSGLGFSIISPKFLNISMWDEEMPSVIHPQVYEMMGRDFPTSSTRRVDLSGEGPYCVWEAHILGHESKAWARFLRSDKTERDKVAYLINVFDGEI